MCVSPFQWCCKKYQFHLLSGRTAQIFDIMTYYLVILPFKLYFPNSIITDEEEKYYLFSEEPVLCFRYADGEYPVALRNIFENARESSYPTAWAISLIKISVEPSSSFACYGDPSYNLRTSDRSPSVRKRAD